MSRRACIRSEARRRTPFRGSSRHRQATARCPGAPISSPGTRCTMSKSAGKWRSSCLVTFRSQRGNAAFSARPQFRNACFVTFACRPMPPVVWSDRRRRNVLPLSEWPRPTRQRLAAHRCASCRPVQPLGYAPQRRDEKGRFGNRSRSGSTSPVSCSKWHA